MLTRGNGAWFKNTLFVAAAKAAGSIVSIPQKACSAILRGFEPRSRDRESMIHDFFIMRQPANIDNKKLFMFLLTVTIIHCMFL